MNWIALLQQEPWPSVMRALLHSLWQGALVALALYVILRRMPVQRTGLRYALCLAGLALVLVAASVTSGLGNVRARRMAVPAAVMTQPVAPAAESPVAPATEELAPANAQSVPVAQHAPWLAWGAAAWLIGVTLMALRVAFSLVGAWRLRRSCRALEDVAVAALARQAQSALKIGRRVTLALASASTGLLVTAVVLLDRLTTATVLPTFLVLAGLAVGTVAVVRAWARPPVQDSVDGSVAGPT